MAGRDRAGRGGPRDRRPRRRACRRTARAGRRTRTRRAARRSGRRAISRPTRTRRPIVHQSSAAPSMIASAGTTVGSSPATGLERRVRDLQLDDHRRGRVLAGVLADLPLPAEHPQRIGDLGGEAAADVGVRRHRLQPAVQLPGHRRRPPGCCRRRPVVRNIDVGTASAHSPRPSGWAIRARASRAGGEHRSPAATSAVSGTSLVRRDGEEDRLRRPGPRRVEAERGVRRVPRARHRLGPVVEQGDGRRTGDPGGRSVDDDVALAGRRHAPQLVRGGGRGGPRGAQLVGLQAGHRRSDRGDDLQPRFGRGRRRVSGGRTAGADQRQAGRRDEQGADPRRQRWPRRRWRR